MRFLVRHFLRGLLVVVPAAATIWILLTIFVYLDDLIRLPADRAWDVPWIGEVSGEALAFRGVGFLLALVLITLIGFLTTNILTRWVFARIERLFTRVPVVKLLYNSIKDLIGAFVSEKKKFDKPVLLSLGDDLGAEVIGFVTRESLAELGEPERVAVYVPQSYNFAANLLVVPRERIRPIELPAADVMAFVVSGGVSDADRSRRDGDPASAATGRAASPAR